MASCRTVPGAISDIGASHAALYHWGQLSTSVLYEHIANQSGHARYLMISCIEIRLSGFFDQPLVLPAMSPRPHRPKPQKPRHENCFYTTRTLTQELDHIEDHRELRPSSDFAVFSIWKFVDRAQTCQGGTRKSPGRPRSDEIYYSQRHICCKQSGPDHGQNP